MTAYAMTKSYELRVELRGVQHKDRISDSESYMTSLNLIGDGFGDLEEIVRFQKGLRSIIKYTRAHLENVHHISLTRGAFFPSDSGMDPLFDEWTADPGDVCEEGIHFNANAKYTRPEWDLWLEFGKDAFAQLAEQSV